jgi:polyisoprenoid-binding protein YceI
MKKNYQNKYFIKVTLFATFLALIVQAKAQTQTLISSSVNLSTEVNGNINRLTDESAFISLNDGSNSFTARVSLLPIVNNADKKDSIALENNLLELNFTGQFPIENFSFYFDKNDNKTYEMNGLLTINGITNPYTITFTLRTPLRADITDEDVVPSTDDAYYPAEISFLITVNPADFGLDLEPFAFKGEVIAEVINGIINKLN